MKKEPAGDSGVSNYIPNELCHASPQAVNSRKAWLKHFFAALEPLIEPLYWTCMKAKADLQTERDLVRVKQADEERQL